MEDLHEPGPDDVVVAAEIAYQLFATLADLDWSVTAGDLDWGLPPNAGARHHRPDLPGFQRGQRDRAAACRARAPTTPISRLPSW